MIHRRITSRFVLLAGLILLGGQPSVSKESLPPQASHGSSSVTVSNDGIVEAFQRRKSHIQLGGSGHIVKLLQDDHKGARHQRFLATINAQQTLLFAHNIDLAPRIPLETGDEISFFGEYIYNPKGGIMHWTHHDPNGHDPKRYDSKDHDTKRSHVGGWIMHKGRKYQ